MSILKRKHAILILVGAVLAGLLIYWMGVGGSSAFNYVFRGTSLKTEDGRISVLFLGIAGGKHDGATLTDTVMVASYDLKTHRADLISIPRDLWLEKHKARVNTLYQTGLLQGDGLSFTRGEISEMLGISIPYAIRVDFSGFIKAIDLINGVDVDVVQSFDDYEYPVEGREDDLCGNKEQEVDIDEGKSRELNIPEGKQRVYLKVDGKIATTSADLDLSCRFEHVSFKKGTAHMNGETALKFTRSRHGDNQEGSDFARSQRQQLILESFKNRVLSIETLTDLSKLVNLAKTFGDSIQTDIPQSKYLELAALTQKITGTRSYVIDFNGKNPLLIHPNPLDYGGAWVLIPPNNDFTNIKKFMDDIVSGRLSEASTSAKSQ